MTSTRVSAVDFFTAEAPRRRVSVPLWLLGPLLLTGCTTALQDKSDLYYRAYQPLQLGNRFSYTGSTSSEHYFYKKRWLKFDRRFTLPVTELHFHCVMPKTSDRSLWRQVTIRSNHLQFYRRDSEVGGYGIFEQIDFVIQSVAITRPRSTAISVGMARSDTLLRLQQNGAVEVPKAVAPDGKGWAIANRSDCLYLSFTNDVLASITVELNADQPKMFQNWYATNVYELR